MKTFVFCFVISQLAYSTSALAFGGQVLLETTCPVKEPTGMATDGSFLWISDMDSRAYVKMRLTDRKVVQRMEAPGFLPSGITIAKGILYTADRRRDTIDRRNLEQKTQLSPIPYYERWATGITHDGTALWIVDARQHKIHQIDPVDGTGGPLGNQPRVLLANFTSDSITGTSTSTPTTVARAAPECRPNREMATATASSKKLLVPISAAGAATLWGRRRRFAAR